MRPAERLSALLRAERARVLDGDLTAILDPAPEKDALIAALDASSPTEDELVSVRKDAQALATLIAACKRGVETAQDRLAAQNEVRKGLTTYGPEGQNRTYASQGAKLGKRF